MPTYSILLLDKKGKISRLKKETQDINSLKDELQKNGYYILKIKEIQNFHIYFFDRIKEEDLVIAIRELSTFLNSKISLDDSLTAMISQMKEGKLKKIFTEIQKSIREGASFSQSLKKFSNLFSEMIISMVKVGEETGSLDLVLLRISDFLEKKITFKNRIKTIMTYPIFMVVVALLVVFFILSFIIPTITRIFSEISIKLPLTTTILIQLASFLRAYFLILLALIIFSIISFKNFIRSEKGKIWVEKIIWKIPFVSDIFLKKELINFSKTLATLIDGGVDLIESLNIAKNVLNSFFLKKEIEKISEYVSKGTSLSAAFNKSEYFPYLFTQLIGAGEKSGEVSKMLDKIGNIYEEEITHRSTRFITFLEPLMILFMGGIVGFIVMSVLLPIFQISQTIK